MLDEYEQWRRQNAGLYRDTSVDAFRDARDLQRLRSAERDLMALFREEGPRIDPDRQWIIDRAVDILEGTA